MSGATTKPDLGPLLTAAQVTSVMVDAIAAEERSLTLPLAAHVTLTTGDGDAAGVIAGADDAQTSALLTAAVAATPDARLVLVVDPWARSRNAVTAWAATAPDWLVLDDPPEGVEVLAPAATVAACAGLPGVWRGGPAAPPAAAAPLARPVRPRPVATRPPALDDRHRLEADRLRQQLLEQRAWVAAEAERARGSTTWRVGNRLVRTVRVLTFRRDRGTDALSRMAERMQEPLDP